MDAVDRIRAFNRVHTARMGLLARSYLGRGLGLTEARLLYELGEGGEPAAGPGTGPGARDLARRLDLDEGQASRALAALERRGWLARELGPDARRRSLRLTPSGRAARAELEAASRTAVAALLASLPEAEREELAACLGRATALLVGGADPRGGPAPGATPGPATSPSFRLRAPEPGDLGWVVGRHGTLYAAEFGYDASFEGLVAGIVAGFAARADAARERAWIAAEGADGTGERLGCAFVMAEGAAEPEVARLRLVLVEPRARGRGLGQALLDAATGFAREAGCRRMRLWTHAEHEAAGRLYARNGFALLSSARAHAFGQDVTDETWERAL